MGAILPLAVCFGAQAQGDPARSRTVLRPSAAAVEVRKSSYTATDGTVLPFDVYYDGTRAGRRATLVLLSGNDDPRAWGAYADLGRLAAQRGFAAVVTAKRFPRTNAGIESGYGDVQSLLEQLQERVDVADRERTCLWGFSAGGRLLSLAFAPQAPALRCAIGFYPVFTAFADAPSDWTRRFIPVDAVLASGTASSPPMLIVRAGKDTAEINQGIGSFASNALRRNVPITVVNLPEARHAFDWHDDTAWSRQAIEDTFEFAKRATAQAAD
ncbi:alpha/beta hydrolase [Luteimonas aquatica]|uniref:alpha/beta hydrolase n=1 Tax=Luteimonas aquatica TaxID=450364 RepID=UPI001F57CD36|nr:dienelactone hydrolase family protein [Luteimonas aquatica]